MERIIKDPTEFKEYKTIESFEEMYSDTKTKQLKQIPDPKVYPLKFPYSVFF